MKRPPSCGCGCNCRVQWTPGDNVPREQWLYDAALVLDNNPIQDVLTAPFAIQFDGLPAGPATLPGGVRAFGPTPAGGQATGWGYFNVNPESVRFQTKCDWPDMALDSIDPLFAIERSDHPYPDVDLHDNPRRGHVPFTFGATTKVCQWQTSFEHVVHSSDYLVGEIPDAIQNITITFDDMYFRPTDFYVDRVQLFKVYTPMSAVGGTPNIHEPLAAYSCAVYAVYFNSNMGTDAVPITSVPRSECSFTPQHPQHAYTIVPAGAWVATGLPNATTGTLDATRAKSDVLKRENLLPGWKITVPEIAGDPHVGRTVEDSIDIYSSIAFDSGHWTVTPTIKLLKCDAQLCHYYSIPVTQNAVLVAPPDNSRIGNEAILPLVSSAVLGAVWVWETPTVRKFFTTTNPTTGVFIKLRKMQDQLNPDGFNMWDDVPILISSEDSSTVWTTHTNGDDGLPMTIAEVQAFLDSFDSGDIIAINRTLTVPTRFPDTRLATASFVPTTTGYYQLPAFLGEQDVTYTFEPHSTRLLDTTRDITSLAAQIPNSQIPADGYEHTMTDAEQALYRQAADPVTIPLEVKEITHAVDTRVLPFTAVADGFAVCFHASWGGTAPNYDYPPHGGPVKTETHSVPGATIVRETI